MAESKTGLAAIIISLTLIISGFGTLTIGAYLGYMLLDLTDYPARQAAGYANFSGGNIANNETVNLTYSGTTVSFCFGTNGTFSVPAWCHNVSIVYPYNNSANASQNLSAAISGNTTSGTTWGLTTSNGTNQTIVYARAGSAGNYIATTESVSSMTWRNGYLSGGKDEIPGQAAIAAYMGITMGLFGLLMMVAGFMVLLGQVNTMRGTERR